MVMRCRKGIVFLGIAISILCTGCNGIDFHFSPAFSIGRKAEQNTQQDNNESEVLGTLKTLCEAKSKKELKDLVDTDFQNNTVSLALDDKSDKEVKIFLEILKRVEFTSYDGSTLRFQIPSNDDIIKFLSEDYNGFVKDYNNFISLKMSDKELSDYVLDYLIQLFSSDSSSEIKMTKQKCNLPMGKNGKFTSDTFLTKLANSILNNLPAKIKGTTFSPAPIDNKAKIATSDFKIRKSKVMLCPVKDKDGKLISQQKILVTVDTLEKDQAAYEKLCSINQMNESINVNYGGDSLYYVHYSIENLSGSDLVYNDCFRLVDGYKNSYTIPTGTCFGLTSSSVLKNGSTTSLDTVLIGPKDAKLGWYDSINSYFYQLGGENA